MTDGSRDSEHENEYKKEHPIYCPSCKIEPRNYSQEVHIVYSDGMKFMSYVCGNCNHTSGKLPIDPPYTMMHDEYVAWRKELGKNWIL